MSITLTKICRKALPDVACRAASHLPRTCMRRIAQPSRIRLFSASFPSREKKYTHDHEWIEVAAEKVNDQSIGTIGISEYASKALGDVVYIELPEVDGKFNAGDTIGAVESVKSASDIMTPVAGVIKEANSLLEEKPGTINKSPEGNGWIAKIAIDSKVAIEQLMDKAAYDKFTGEQDEGADK